MIAWTWEVFWVGSDDPGKMMVVLQVGRFYYCISKYCFITFPYIFYISFWILLRSFALFILAGGSDIVCRFLLLQPSRDRKQKLPLLARETCQDSVADESKMANTIKIIMGSYHWLINVKKNGSPSHHRCCFQVQIRNKATPNSFKIWRRTSLSMWSIDGEEQFMFGNSMGTITWIWISRCKERFEMVARFTKYYFFWFLLSTLWLWGIMCFGARTRNGRLH